MECACDRLWESGVPLQEENCFNKAGWSGDNLLGKILMKVRGKNKDIIVGNIPTDMITQVPVSVPTGYNIAFVWLEYWS